MTADQTPDSSVPTSAAIPERLGVGLATACVVARLLIPTESAHLGDTLWITTLSLIAATVYSIGRWQDGHRLQFDLFTGAVALIVLGHIVSGVWILWDVGNKRSAVNMMWEWTSLGATCFVLRGRRPILYVLLAMMLVNAGHGLWQYFVDFPAQRQEYSALLDGTGTVFERESQRKALEARGIVTTASGLRLFADRMRSLEPLGPFALTNTLGGFLAVGLLFCVAVLFGSNRSAGQYVVGLLLMAPLAYCLFLTKSRTAIVATAAGVVLFGILRTLAKRKQGEHQARSKVAQFVSIAAVLLVVGAVVAGVATGGLDEQVISESPKSLRYRLMYWQGTIATLQDSLWLGTGPGNFRQHYTAHKLAASSEEILDPHNLFLDAWCNGGVIALVGLLLLVVVASRGLFDRTTQNATEPTPLTRGLFAGLLGFAAVLIQQFLTGQENFPQALSLAGGFVVAWFAIQYVCRNLDDALIRLAAAVATCGLIIHLLGAGGFSMPAVAQVLLIGTAATIPTRLKMGVRHWPGLIPALAGAAVVSGCLITATIPVTQASMLVREGNSAVGNNALRAYGAADMRDTLCPIAISKFGRKQMQLGIAPYPALHRAMRRDPKDFKHSLALGTALRQAWLTSPPGYRIQDNIDAAVQRMKVARDRYPTNPRLVTELALAQSDAGQLKDARQTALKALQLDEINRQNGHQDRYLDNSILTQLTAISERTIQEAADSPLSP